MIAPTSEEIVQAIQALCDRVTAGAQAPQGADLAATLGTVKEQGGGAVYVDPAAAPFRKAVVSADADGEAESLLLTLPEPSSSLAAALAGPLGAPSFPPAVGGGAFRATWAVDPDPSRSRVCQVSVTFAGPPNRQTLAGSVTEVGIRIDPRL